MFDGDSGRSEDKILICDVMDVEDLIFFHEVCECVMFRSLYSAGSRQVS